MRLSGCPSPTPSSTTVDQAHGQLRGLVEEQLTEVRETGELRDDVPTAELATYCVYSLTAAGSLPSKAAVRRLVEVTVAGLDPQV